jgi:hypothetical protein
VVKVPAAGGEGQPTGILEKGEERGKVDQDRTGQERDEGRGVERRSMKMKIRLDG